MSTNHTENYDLCQWLATDPVLRTDFNSDNAKIDAALTTLANQEDMLNRVIQNLAFYACQSGLLHLLKWGYHPDNKSILCEAFLNSSRFSLSGSAALQNNTICVNGVGNTGTLETQSLVVQASGWTRAMLWVHLLGGTVAASINGEAMSGPVQTVGHTPQFTTCVEAAFTLDTATQSSAKLKLDLTCGSGGAMQVFDYSLFFF